MHKLRKRILILLCLPAALLFAYYIGYGIPVFGMPDAEEITQVELHFPDTDETVMVTHAEKPVYVGLAVNLAALLSHDLFRAEPNEFPRLTMTYYTEDGPAKVISVSDNNVYLNGTAHRLRGVDNGGFILIVRDKFLNEPYP